MYLWTIYCYSITAPITELEKNTANQNILFKTKQKQHPKYTRNLHKENVKIWAIY